MMVSIKKTEKGYEVRIGWVLLYLSRAHAHELVRKLKAIFAEDEY